MGFEPQTFRPTVRRANHCATGAVPKNTIEFLMILPKNTAEFLMTLPVYTAESVMTLPKNTVGILMTLPNAYKCHWQIV